KVVGATAHTQGVASKCDVFEQGVVGIGSTQSYGDQPVKKWPCRRGGEAKSHSKSVTGSFLV
ncbi:MAG: hypothetical protein ABL983_14450, partial [Nitrospira sp.]